MKKAIYIMLATMLVLSLAPASASAKTIYMPVKIVMTDHTDDNEKYTEKFTRNKKGTMIKDKTSISGGLAYQTTKYTLNKKKTRQQKAVSKAYVFGELFSTDIYKYYYNKKGQRYKEKKNGELSTKTTYNKKGQVKMVKDYSATGKYKGKTAYNYGSDGYRTQRTEYNKKGKVKSIGNYTYTVKNGLVTKIVLTNAKTGKKESTLTFKYKKYNVSKKQYKALRKEIMNTLSVIYK